MTDLIRNELIEVMKNESSLLDLILEKQSLVHEFVVKRNYEKLESTMSELQALSDDFVELEDKRVELSSQQEVARDPETAPLLSCVRGKLMKSKVENHALNEYIKTTRKFLQGVFDEVVPQRRNTLYTRTGSIVKPELSSLVINQVI